jgi:hypothetical protein
MRASSVGKLLTCLTASLLLAGSMGMTPAAGALLVNESFTYPNGSLIGRTPAVGETWGTHSGTPGQMQVSSGQAVVNHSLSEDANIRFANNTVMGPGDKFYAAFDLTVPAQAQDPGTVYFAHFKDITTFFNSRLFITAPSMAGVGYRLGISGNSTLIASETWPTNLNFDQTYRVVSAYEFNTGAAQMWIDPVNEASFSITATDAPFSNAMEAFALRQSTSNSIQRIDNLRVADDFCQAVGCGPATSSILVPPGDFQGKSQDEWGLEYQQWGIATGLGGQVLPDTADGVRFLPPNIGQTFFADLTIQHGTPLLGLPFNIFGERYDNETEDNPNDPIIGTIFESTTVRVMVDGDLALEGFADQFPERTFDVTMFPAPIPYEMPEPRGPGLNSVAAIFGAGITTIFDNLTVGNHTINFVYNSPFFGPEPFTATYNITVVPEPASLLFVGPGCIWLPMIAWRRGRNPRA